MGYQSIVDVRGVVAFPAWTGERVYMEPFMKREGLPVHLSRWQDTVDAMLDGIETDRPVYIMIDQGEVTSGNAHRRPGLHVDGHWVPSLSAHGVPGGHERPERGPDWRMPGGHRPPGRHAIHGVRPEGIILASDVAACRAYAGPYDVEFGPGGECDGLDTSTLAEIMFEPNRVYAGNVAMLHESLPLSRDARRTCVRLNVPGWSPELH